MESKEDLGVVEVGEIKQKVQMKLSRSALAVADASATLRGVRSRDGIVDEWLRWAWDSVDPNTGELPDVNPVSGRSKEEILNAVQSPRAKRAGRSG